MNAYVVSIPETATEKKQKEIGFPSMSEEVEDMVLLYTTEEWYNKL